MSKTQYVKTYTVKWSDLDANVHLRNTAYLDYAAQSRFEYLAEHGFAPQDFQRHRMGPVIFSEMVEYRKELKLLESFSVSMLCGGLNADGSHYVMVNEFRNSKGELAARVSTRAAWFSLESRKIVTPAPALKTAMESMPRTEDFSDLTTSKAA